MQHNDSWSWTRRTFMKSSVAGALLFVGQLLDLPAARSEGTRICQAPSESEAPPSCMPWQEARISRRSRLGCQLCPGSISPDAPGIGIQQLGV